MTIARLLVFVLLGPALLIARPARAQVEVGLSLGAASSIVFWDFGACPPEQGPGCVSSAFPAEPRRSAAGGAFLRVPLGRGFALQPELLYAAKGYARTEPTLRFTYLEAPVLLRYDIGGGRFQPFGAAGVAPAYEINCSVAFYGLEGTEWRRCSADPSATVSWDMGAVVAAGVAAAAGPGRLALEVRHTRGLRDIEPPRPGRTLHRTSALLARYAVPLRR